MLISTVSADVDSPIGKMLTVLREEYCLRCGIVCKPLMLLLASQYFHSAKTERWICAKTSASTLKRSGELHPIPQALCIRMLLFSDLRLENLICQLRVIYELTMLSPEN